MNLDRIEKALDDLIIATAPYDKYRGLTDVVGGIMDAVTDLRSQELLDAAIQHQDMEPCRDIDAWASRLAEDVKDADD